MKHLGLAQEQLNAKDEKKFYKAISDALLGFVSDKLGLETADITKSNVRKNLEQLQISELAIGEFMKILQASELALYGASSPGGMEDHFEKVRELLITIESGFQEQA